MPSFFPPIFCLWAGAQKTYIQCGSLIDGISNDTRSTMTIVVEGGKILSVEKGFTGGSPTDSLINLQGKTVVPGWIDCHMHLSHQTSRNNYLEEFQLNDVMYAYRSVGFARTMLLAGFTTVKDAGGGIVIVLKKAINEGLVDGPCIIAAGTPIGSTGSAAALLGMQDSIGTIEAGKWADLIATDGNPLQDTEAFGRVVFVMKEGKVYRR